MERLELSVNHKIIISGKLRFTEINKTIDPRVSYRIFGLGGEKSIGASTKCGNVRGLGVFSQILGRGKVNLGGGGEIPGSPPPPPPLLYETLDPISIFCYTFIRNVQEY